MNCTTLPSTGLESSGVIMAIALLIGVGLVLVVFGRHRHRSAGIGVLAVMLALGLVCLPIAAPPALAAATDCVVDPGPANSLAIVQTSTMAGMAPNVEPAAITGRVTSQSADDTYILEVVVSIAAVTKSSGASAGTCDASDYVIVAPVMLVGASLEGGASVDFAGASIGFVDQVTNQDACQGATVTLLYTVG